MGTLKKMEFFGEKIICIRKALSFFEEKRTISDINYKCCHTQLQYSFLVLTSKIILDIKYVMCIVQITN